MIKFKVLLQADKYLVVKTQFIKNNPMEKNMTKQTIDIYYQTINTEIIFQFEKNRCNFIISTMNRNTLLT